MRLLAAILWVILCLCIYTHVEREKRNEGNDRGVIRDSGSSKRGTSERKLRNRVAPSRNAYWEGNTEGEVERRWGWPEWPAD